MGGRNVSRSTRSAEGLPVGDLSMLYHRQFSYFGSPLKLLNDDNQKLLHPTVLRGVHA